MAGRPHKQGLDFFPIDTDIFDNNKIDNLLVAKGSDGFLFLIQLWGFIYTNGNHLYWDETTARRFRKNFGYKDNIIIDQYMGYLFKEGILHKALFDQYNVLTSDSIQERYLVSTKRREKVIFIQEFLLIDLDTYAVTGKRVNIDNDETTERLVEVRDINGSLVRKYIKPKTEKRNRVAKPKPKAVPITPQPVKSSVPLKLITPIDNTSTMRIFTSDNVMEFMAVTYEKRDEMFKDSYSKEEYNDYILLNKKINSSYRKIRKSIRQLTFQEYLEFIDESTPTPTLAQLEECFKEMHTLEIAKETDIYKLLGICYEKVLKNTEPDIPMAIPYIKDEALEKEVLDYWGLGQIKTPKQWMLMTYFCTAMHNSGQLEWFKTQWRSYKQVTDLRGSRFKHSFENFLGKQADLFVDGAWNAENWTDRLSGERTVSKKNKQPSTSKVEAAMDSHSDFMDQFKK